MKKLEPSGITGVMVPVKEEIHGAFHVYANATQALLSGNPRLASEIADEWFTSKSTLQRSFFLTLRNSARSLRVGQNQARGARQKDPDWTHKAPIAIGRIMESVTEVAIRLSAPRNSRCYPEPDRLHGKDASGRDLKFGIYHGHPGLNGPMRIVLGQDLGDVICEVQLGLQLCAGGGPGISFPAEED